MSPDYKKYQFSINVKTNKDPRDAIFEIVNQLKGLIPVLSIDYRLVEERDTNIEHHGGLNDSSELET
jgi:hypothetical protein